ncbi:hypothetical protein Pedsa_0338 [Pseudopedobacter saltans DSM 12145]|uniref:DUF4230 domain-containing protein n=1 Tax=Pseudopedobacter saltans (strain ATCC 51119 / DSM 12145 / JCM 21818 / CCUG 39354 / LMG 10337 / NBRC 100064 / NCIMB 13643) TaxID=762903 RepID=F0S4G3_PSESL|nr:DUF4230 domain-containing protein [Pseudopedobacter saltans]ADY50920.1 hypothetical protein Pedsa_0338 [Pseudopedobacter saltans DSM 12145]
MKFRPALSLSFFIILLAALAFMFFYFKKQLFEVKTEITEDVMISKITSMGKLELVKYSMKDVIEKKEIRRFLPDERILFVAVGEVVGCIDLTKVSKDDISFNNDSLTLYLPRPEICYVKIDHKASKVYDVSGVWFPSDTKNLVEGIYKIAEQKLLMNAKEMQLMQKTKENATLIFKPLVENLSNKKVGILFK